MDYQGMKSVLAKLTEQKYADHRTLQALQLALSKGFQHLVPSHYLLKFDHKLSLQNRKQILSLISTCTLHNNKLSQYFSSSQNGIVVQSILNGQAHGLSSTQGVDPQIMEIYDRQGKLRSMLEQHVNSSRVVAGGKLDWDDVGEMVRGECLRYDLKRSSVLLQRDQTQSKYQLEQMLIS